MRRLIVSLVVLGFCVRAYPQDAKPYLRLEAGSHTAMVRRIDVDAAEQFLVSASDDKTARVWDLHSGKLLQVLRPPIGDGEEGKLYAVAISPDGTTIAVGGFTGGNRSGNYPIYIFDRASGAIRKVTSGIPQVTEHLEYSRDGRYLAAALGGNLGIRIYETQTYTKVSRDSDFADYADDSYWVEFDKAGRIVSTSLDGYVRLYGSDFHLVAKQKPPGGKQPFSARFSPDGNYVAVGFNDSPMVDVLLAKDLSFQFSKQLPGSGLNLVATSWAADGRALCAAGLYNVNNVFPVLCWNNAGKGTQSSFPIAGNTILDLRPLRDGGMAFAVSDGTVGVLAPGGAVKWRENPNVLDYRYRFFGAPPSPWLSSDGNTVEVGGHYFNGTKWTNHTIRFSVQERKLDIDPQDDSSLSRPETKGLDVKDWEGSTSPTIDGAPLKLNQYEISRSLAIAPKQDSFILGADWGIYRFDRQGKQIWGVPVPEFAIGVNISHDGRYVVATLGDGTVRWYTFDTGKEVLALFVDRDLKRWVVWNPDGFFTFGGDGADSLIGYQINRGPDKGGDFVKVDQLRKLFYRPDLIAQILQPDGVEAALAARNSVGDVSKVLSVGLPPQIKIIQGSPSMGGDSYEVKFQVEDQGGGIGKLVCKLEGAEIPCLSGRDPDIAGTGSLTATRKVPVPPGHHTIDILAYSKDGKIEGRAVSVQVTGSQPTGRPNLYVVAAGISHYMDHSLDDGVTFAEKDAESVAASFKQQEGKGLYGKVSTVTLPDDRATGTGIRTAVEQAASQVKPGDTFILYLSGHGTNVQAAQDEELKGKEGYYFIPYDAVYTNLVDLVKKSLSGENIQQLLALIKTNKSLLLLDTCNSGAISGGRGPATEKGNLERIAVMSGRAVLTASNDTAMDGYQGHGVFTFALIEGLQSAQPDPDGEISITRLAEYVQNRVPDLSYEKWHIRQYPMYRLVGQPFPIVHKP